MSLQIPGYSVPSPYPSNPDIIGQFGKGYDFSRGIVNENEAKQALGEYVKSLYAGGAPQGAAPAPAASSNPIDALIGAEHSSASGAATDPALTTYFAKLGQSESGGDPNAKNPNSSATGLYQITDGTWNGLMQAHPELGLTQDGRTDPNQQQKAVRVLTADNAGALKHAGQPINPATLYMSHFLGAPTATQVLGYADDAPMASAVPADVIAANPQLKDMNVGAFKQWAGQQGGDPQTGYRPPMMPQQSGNGLPPQEVLDSLVQNPETRNLGLSLMQRVTDPSAAIDLATKRATLALDQKKLGGSFTGDGMDAQAWNILQTADPSSKEYATAYSIVSQPKSQLVQTAQGQVLVNLPPQLPDWLKAPGGSAPATPDAAPQSPPGTAPAPPGATAPNAPPIIPGTKPAATEQQARNHAIGSILLNEIPTVGATFGSLADPKGQLLNAIPGGLGNAWQDPKYQQAASAVSTSVSDILYSLSGASSNPGEVINQIKNLTPQFGDKPPVIADKLNRFKAYVRSIASEANDPGLSQQVEDAIGKMDAPAANAAPPSVDDLLKKYGG